MRRQRQSPVVNRLRARREHVQLSQGQLAEQVGSSRQTLNAIETGRAVPGTALALRLAAVLSCQVEDLFQLEDAEEELTAEVAGGPQEVAAGTPVLLSVVGRRSVAVPLVGSLAAFTSLPEADGVVRGRHGATVRVGLIAANERLAETVVITGCDPTTPVVAGHLRRRHPRYGLRWLPAGSLQALRWLREGAAHVAGMHLRDARVGQETAPAVRRVLRGMDVVVLRFAIWEEGLIVARDNPLGLHEVADLGRPEVSIVNRERGSGARALLDAELAKGGLSPAQLRGYQREARTHFAVAQAVALGVVDAGIGIRAAARIHGLTFVPLRRERYDLVVPRALLTHPPVDAFLDTLQQGAVRRALEAAGDYDTSELGSTQEVPS